ncbi:hypothetical protein PLICRDRAFT_171544 [Plicaturopsis crispa FD-325 SS-3]|nr:hypothetical protein PLICRDRAFT_171544 [Plicaturopsis crispa FD-325 SS-3]
MDIDDRGIPINRTILRDPSIRIIDLGNAVYHNDERAVITGTIGYNAPEIVSDLPWSYTVDSWSIGCIAAGVYLGRPLFPDTWSIAEQLHVIELTIGEFPSDCRRTIERKRPGMFSKTCPSRIAYAPGMRQTGLHVSYYADHSKCRSLVSLVKDAALRSLLLDLLNIHPGRRALPENAMKHPYFTRNDVNAV